MQNLRVDYLLLFVLALIWSTSFLLIKIGVTDIPPITLTAARMVVAAAVLVAYLAVTKTALPLNRRAWRMYFMVGFMGNTLPFILISWGETRIDSSLAAIMMGVMPITTFVLAHFFIPDEPMTARKIFGVALGFGGLATLVGAPAFISIGGGGDILAQLAVLLAAISYGVTTVFVRAQPSFGGAQMATGAVLVGMVGGVLLALVFDDWPTTPPAATSIGAMIILGVMPTALAALIYFRLINTLGATTFSQLNYAVPVLGGLWGALLLGETLKLTMLVALAMVLTGVYFVHAKRGASNP